MCPRHIIIVFSWGKLTVTIVSTKLDSFLVERITKLHNPITTRGIGSLVPSLFYRTWKKSLVKCVFNFGSVWQDLDTANQIAEQCLHHGHVWKKNCNSDLKELREGWSLLVQQAIDEATHCLSLAKCTCSLGEVKSPALLTQIIMQARIVLLCEHHNMSRTFNGNQNWIRISPDSFSAYDKRLGMRLGHRQEGFEWTPFWQASKHYLFHIKLACLPSASMLQLQLSLVLSMGVSIHWTGLSN